MFILSIIVCGLSWRLVFGLLFICAMIIVSFTDAHRQIIPNKIVYPLAATAVASWWVTQTVTPLDGLWGMLSGAGPLLLAQGLSWLLLRKPGVGWGDIKLMAAAGLFLGWQMALLAFVLGIFAGGLYGAFMLLSGRMKRGQYLPLGPFLALGCTTALLIGQRILDWYLYEVLQLL